MSGRSWARKAARISSRDHGEADRPDDHGVALAEGLLRHPSHTWRSRCCSCTGTVTAGQLDLALELAEVEVEPRAVDRGPADLLELDRQHLEGPVELAAVALDVGGQLAQVGDVVDQRRADPLDQRGGLHRELGDLVERAEDRVAVAVEAAHELPERRDQLVELLVAVGDVVEHLAEVVDEVADHLVAVGQGAGHRGGVGQQALERAALALEDLDDLVGQLVDVGGAERLEERLEPVEQHGEVERRRGARDRDRRARRPACSPSRPPGSGRCSAGRRGCGT